LSFNVLEVPDKEIFLVIEGAENFDITLNGFENSKQMSGWYMDRAFDKVKLFGVKKGENELVLKFPFYESLELEDCYIIGDFAVDMGRNIKAEPEKLHFGDWCLQGYLHYCGSIIYHFNLDYQKTEADRAVLELGEYSAVTVEVRVNGVTAGHIPWKAANKLDITRFLSEGSNTIDIEAMGSPRNLFGPFHQVYTGSSRIDWTDFRTEGKFYTGEYVLMPYGLMGQVNIFKHES
jgi:hypothetical protein